jgi:hypothetical protein
MSENNLADRKVRRRARQEFRARETAREPRQSQDMKITLLGDFLSPSDEPQGCDPYNSVQGKPPRES